MNITFSNFECRISLPFFYYCLYFRRRNHWWFTIPCILYRQVYNRSRWITQMKFSSFPSDLPLESVYDWSIRHDTTWSLTLSGIVEGGGIKYGMELYGASWFKAWSDVEGCNPRLLLVGRRGVRICRSNVFILKLPAILK